MVELFPATPRVQALRKAYLTESPMAMGIGRVRGTPYNMIGTRRLRLAEGWMQNCGGSTRLRYCRSEAYMLSHMNPVLTEGELIAGLPRSVCGSAGARGRLQRLLCENGEGNAG